MERRIGLPSKLPNAHCWPIFLILLHLFTKKIKKVFLGILEGLLVTTSKKWHPPKSCKSRFLSRSDLCHLTGRGECHGCPWFKLGAAPHHPRPWSKLRLLLLCTSLCLRPPGLASPSSAHPRPRLNSTKKEIWRHRSSSVPSKLQRFGRMKWI